MPFGTRCMFRRRALLYLIKVLIFAQQSERHEIPLFLSGTRLGFATPWLEGIVSSEGSMCRIRHRRVSTIISRDLQNRSSRVEGLRWKTATIVPDHDSRR
jgi:hypothetical protein